MMIKISLQTAFGCDGCNRQVAVGRTTVIIRAERGLRVHGIGDSGWRRASGGRTIEHSVVDVSVRILVAVAVGTCCFFC